MGRMPNKRDANRCCLGAVLPSGETLLGAAAQLPDGWALDRLLQRGKQDPNQQDVQGRTPLHRAALTGCLRTTEALLSAGAGVNAIDGHGFTPLQLACVQGHVQVAKALIEAHSKCAANSSDQSEAGVGENGSLELLSVLLEAGINMDASDSWDTTALMNAIKYRGSRDLIL